MLNKKYMHIFKYNRIMLFFSVIVTIFIYVISVLCLAELNSVSFNEVMLFKYEIKNIDIGLLILTFLALLTSVALVLLPGYIWVIVFKNRFKNYLFFFSYVFSASICLIISSSIMYKLILAKTISRSSFLFIIFLVCLCGLFVLKKHGKITIFNSGHLKRKIISVFIFGAILTGIVLIPFWNKYFIEDMNGDSKQCYDFATSVKTHIFPNGYFLTNSDEVAGTIKGVRVAEGGIIRDYVHMGALLLWGDTIVSIRLLYVLYIFMIMVILSSFIPTHNVWADSIVLGCLSAQIFLHVVISFYYTSNNLYFVGISKLAVEAFLLVLFLLEIYFLINKEGKLFLVYSLLVAYTRVSGSILTVILFLSYWITFRGKQERIFLKKCISKYMILIGLISGIYLVIGLYNGYLYHWFLGFKEEFILDYVSVNINAMLFLKYFFICVGGAPLIGIFFMGLKDKTSRLLTLIIIFYLAVVLAGGYKNIHYFAPIVLLPILVVLRYITKYNLFKMTLLCIPFFINIVYFIAISYPKNDQVHVAFQQNGARTCLMFRSFEEARKVIPEFTNAKGLEYPCLSWMYYADIMMSPKKKYDFYFSDTNEPPVLNVKLYDSDGKCYFWTNENLQSIIEKVPSREEIFSDIFREIIDYCPS